MDISGGNNENSDTRVFKLLYSLDDLIIYTTELIFYFISVIIILKRLYRPKFGNNYTIKINGVASR